MILINYSKECQFLEKNYLQCLLQKALKDRVEKNQCDLEHVLYFHTECPDYAKKYDDPVEGKAFLRKQMFHLLNYPYQSFKNAVEPKLSVASIEKAERYLEYPELSEKRNRAGPEFALLTGASLNADL